MKIEIDLSKFTTVESIDNVQGGQVVFNGRRYRVADLLYQLADGYVDSVDNIVEDFDQDRDQMTIFLKELAKQFEGKPAHG